MKPSKNHPSVKPEVEGQMVLFPGMTEPEPLGDYEEELVVSCVLQMPYTGTFDQAKNAIGRILKEVKLIVNDDAQVTGFTIQSATRVAQVPKAQ